MPTHWDMAACRSKGDGVHGMDIWMLLPAAGKHFR